MSHYLNDKIFNFYCSGVYDGKIKFGEVMELLNVDRRTRVQLKREPFSPEKKPTTIDIQKLNNELSVYCKAGWGDKNDHIILENGCEYNRYITMDSDKGTAQIWAQRKSTGIMDIITVDGKIVAFFNPGRVHTELLVLEGYENCTPLVKYNDPLLSDAKYGVNHLGNIMVPAKDGTLLATEVFLPELPSLSGHTGTVQVKKFPAIVVRTCYNKAREIQRCWHWVARGYAFVVQDVRGRSDSDGILEPFQNEREDASALFDWIAAQPWSDGNIGMWGASYLGYTTTSAATSGNPHLKTAVSEVNVGSPFYDTARRGGAICSWPLLCWTLGQSVSNRVDFGVFGGETVDKDEVIATRPITEIPQKIIGKASDPWDLWAQHYLYDDFWQHSDNTIHSKNIKIPMLILSGWYDGDALGVQETWRFLTGNNTPGRRIILGPWTHGLNSSRDVLDLAFSNDAIDYDFDTRIIRWFDRYLKGVENGEDKQQRAKYYLVGENKWYESSDWNPTESRLVNLYLTSQGNANTMFGDGQVMLTTRGTEDNNRNLNQLGQSSLSGQFDQYTYDPAQPIRGDYDHVIPYVCNAIQMRGDCLVYDTDPLEQDVAIAGNIYAEFYASSSAVDTDFIVRLTDVDEKGVARRISDNIIRAQFRNGWDKPALLEPGKIEKFELEMYFNAYVFKRGHKIRIDVTSSNETEFFPNTNTGVNPYENPEPVIAQNRVYHSEQYPSHVKLPVLYGM